MRETRERIHWVCAMASGRRVLDVGCSSGIVPILLGREGRTVVGIDSDPKAIAEAESYLEQEPSFVQGRIEFVEGDFLDYGGLNGQQFDTVIMSEVLEHLVRPADFLETACRYMAEKSSLIVTVPFGINDFIDHKKTFYLTSIHELLDQYFEVTEVKILGKWIGLVGERPAERSPSHRKGTWETSEVTALEDAFYKIERSLRDELAKAKAEGDRSNDIQRSLRREIAASKTKISDLNDTEIKLQKQLTTTTEELETERATHKSAVKEAERIRQELEEDYQKLADELADKSAILQNTSKKVALLQRQLEQSEKEKAEATQYANQVREAISFQLGHAIIQSTHSWRNLVKLPAEVIRLRREGAARRRAKALQGKPGPEDKRQPISQKSVAQLQAQFLSKADKPSTALRIAAVMDEFTYHSYAPECDLLQLHPDTWRQQLMKFKPDLVFIESAWQGLDELWRTKISNASNEVLDLVQSCRLAKIPTVFWNKEDPVHFGTFLPVAKMVDFVFTTDVDCIPKYKHYVGHDRVFVLPFAAQPKVHNPIECYERKDAFCFAGSYYLRYPERQKDFATLMDSVMEFKPVEIYDRNHGKAHSHYTFPDRYAPLILGRLPFNEIDRAYKGYRYGINVNTIKQSQTMCARRVFELVASNTVVVSNFSRATRLFFGETVISSDDSRELQNRLEGICGDERNYRKLRLMALRKVMAEHTYSLRLDYIRAKLSGQDFQQQLPSVAVVGVARIPEERNRILEHYKRQSYPNKRLFLLQCDEFLPISADEGVRYFNNPNDCVEALSKFLKSAPFISLFVSQDYYGPEFLKDLVLASRYSDAMAFGKTAFYLAGDVNCRLQNDGAQYRTAKSLLARSSLARTGSLTSDWLEKCLASPADVVLQQDKLLAIDEFHYCRNAQGLDEVIVSGDVDDLPLSSQGAALHDDLISIAEGLRPVLHPTGSQGNVPQLSADTLFQMIKQPESSQITLDLRDNVLNLTSRLEGERHAYVYARERFSRQEVNLVSNSTFKLDCLNTVDLHTVFEFYDADEQKISHAINKAGQMNALAIPEECETVRFGFRIRGRGEAQINRLLLGGNGERPAVLLGKSRYLLLTKQYPAYDDLYRYGFVHSRVRAYKQQGLTVDVFRMTSEDGKHYREFEGIDVASGDAALLEATLRAGQYKHVLVHLLDEKMWEILQRHIDEAKVTVWVHGAEIQVWQRRAFEFERMPSEEIERQKRLSDKRVKFWRSLLASTHKNLHLVFVSEWLRNSALADLDLTLPDNSASVIHNFIDTSIFVYKKKRREDRLKILIVRPFNRLIYGNDLCVGAILELSRRSFFKELSFTVVGDGELFEGTISPIRSFPNVVTERRFLTHAELARYHEDNGVFMIPTRMDTQGVSRDEAMASGLVPITCNVGGVSEFVDESCGIIVPPENSLALADAVEFLYEKPETYLKLSASAARRVRAQSGLEHTVQQEIRLIDEDK